jgi:hypothetical protein
MNEQEALGYRVYVGIDWADSKHDVCICPRDSETREFDVIRHRAEVIDAWMKDLHQRYGGTIAVAVELSKGPKADIGFHDRFRRHFETRHASNHKMAAKLINCWVPAVLTDKRYG